MKKQTVQQRVHTLHVDEFMHAQVHDLKKKRMVFFNVSIISCLFGFNLSHYTDCSLVITFYLFIYDRQREDLHFQIYT